MNLPDDGKLEKSWNQGDCNTSSEKDVAFDIQADDKAKQSVQRRSKNNQEILSMVVLRACWHEDFLCFSQFFVRPTTKTFIRMIRNMDMYRNCIGPLGD